MRIQSLLDSFCDELEKIAIHKTAVLGAAIGGYIGSHVPGNKAKMVGIGLGALAGHGVGAAAKAAKRTFHDENAQREHASLYGHEPTYSMANQQGQFF